ncbi:transaldolase family protein [Streptomyces sp. NPDC086023]|uniref:transaldolase family protein n=1 Tax=Streptomyces sp. NPDC086023 TaxID=3365746 RepID=UPI0037D08B49
MTCADLSETPDVLRQLTDEGVTPWLEGIGRAGLDGGQLRRLAGRTGVQGLLCDLGALVQGLRETGAYAAQLAELAARGIPARTALEELLVHDARRACDALLPLYRATDGAQGLVAVPLAPWHGGVDGTVEAAHRTVLAVDRPNVVVVLPATEEGLAASERCLGAGLGVHTGPVFGPDGYTALVQAWFSGLERARARGLDLRAIASFASVRVQDLGATAVGLARLLYECYEAALGAPRWHDLVRAGARPQRLMWTGLGDGGAVERLVGWGTGMALSLPALARVARSTRLRGDTLSGTGPRIGRLPSRGGTAPATAAALAAAHTRAALALWSRAVRLVTRELAAGEPVPPGGAGGPATAGAAQDPVRDGAAQNSVRDGAAQDPVRDGAAQDPVSPGTASGPGRPAASLRGVPAPAAGPCGAAPASAAASAPPPPPR